MKTKAILSILTLAIAISAFSQKATLELTFTAEDNGQYVPLDSILIENLTQGGDTTLYVPDTVLVIDYISGINDNEINRNNSFSISQNYPNPFEGKTDVNLYLPEKESIKIIVRDILGRELSQYENILNRGNHSFVFYAGDEKYNLLTVSGNQTSKTIKMLNASSNPTNGGKCKLVYNKYEDNVIGFKSQNSISNFVFSNGDKLKYTVHSNIGSRSRIDSPSGNETYTFQYAAGMPCPGIPTVTDNEGNTYVTVQIGVQCWISENLRTTTYSNSSPIPNIIDANNWQNLTTGACVWYDNDIYWKDLYGVLYNWYAVNNPYGLCPTGWHVPEHEEWLVLFDFIGGTGSPFGNELKSCRQVNSPEPGECNTFEQPRWDSYSSLIYGTDNYGFSGLPGGSRYYSGTFISVGGNGIWWSSTGYTSFFAWSRSLGSSYSGIGMFGSDKRNGFSVRCLKD